MLATVRPTAEQLEDHRVNEHGRHGASPLDKDDTGPKSKDLTNECKVLAKTQSVQLLVDFTAAGADDCRATCMPHWKRKPIYLSLHGNSSPEKNRSKQTAS